MRLARIRFSARKAVINALKCLHFCSKTRAKNYHPAGREFEIPAVEVIGIVARAGTYSA